ncbi:Adenosylhomocysteinase [Verticillium dahliae VDG1]|nr:Adenosylhomocysteinase [Verticillium dahliae VDG1]
MSLDPCPTTALHELHHDHDAHATSLPTPNSEALAVERELDMDSLAVACIVAQKPVSVTLDGPTICALTLLLVCLVHCVETPLAECLIVCHVHDSDHSLHMTLHPDDIAEVLRKGWGQRHPLARKGWFGAMPVPEEFLMVYAPRDDQELQIVCRIIEAAIWYVTAESEQIEVLYRSRTPSIASSK